MYRIEITTFNCKRCVNIVPMQMLAREKKTEGLLSIPYKEIKKTPWPESVSITM
jgi:hypothetical protein